MIKKRGKVYSNGLMVVNIKDSGSMVSINNNNYIS